MKKNCQSYILVLLVLLLTQELSGQEMRADKMGVKLSGQLVYDIENRTNAITSGYVFALSVNKKEILGFSETSFGPTFDSDPLRQGGRWLIDGLPFNTNIILVGFAKNVQRLNWILPVNTGSNSTLYLGQNLARIYIPNTSPSDSYNSWIQILFIAGWIGEIYEVKRNVEFSDELISNILKMHGEKHGLTTNSPNNSSLISGLISFWKIDETGGTIVKDAHSGNNCLVTPGVLLSQRGLSNNAASFTGTSEGLSSGKIASQLGIEGNTSKSVSIWIKPSSNIYGPASAGLVNLGSRSNQQQFGIKFYGAVGYDFWMFDSWYGAVRIGSDGNKLTDGKWHHIVVTYNSDGHRLRTYLDGNLVTEDATKILYTGDSMPFSIGIGSQGNYEGLIDEVGLWSRALTDSEVSALYNNGIGLSYPFN